MEWNANHEAAIDKVAASGRVSRFGIDLWKARYLLESACLFSAEAELLRRYRERYRSETETIARALCAQAMHEYLAPNCHTCKGAGEIVFDQLDENKRAELERSSRKEDQLLLKHQKLRVTCSECNGSRVHRYSDPERAGMMQISYAQTKFCWHKLRWLLKELEIEDRRVNYVMCAELERSV